MSNRTFFFRKEYTMKEMFERIYAPDFIEAFKQYGGFVDEEGATSEINKSNLLLGLSQSCNNDEDQIYKEMEQAFLTYGREGDKLNVKLYKFEGFDFSINDEVRYRIEGYKVRNQNFKDLDTFRPAGLKNNIYIVDTEYRASSMDIKFRIESNEYIYDPVPKIIIDNKFIEVRLYHSTGLAAVFNPSGTPKNAKDVLTVLFLLYHFQNPIIKEVSFDEAQLIMIQLKLKGQVSSPRLRTDDNLRVDIYGLNEMNYEDPLVTAVNSHAKLRIYELSSICIIHGHRFNLRLSEDGRIQVETFVETDVLDRIILDIEWTIMMSHYFKPLSDQINELLKKKSKALLETHRQRKTRLISQDILKLIEDNRSVSSLGEKAANLTSTIMLNISHFLLKKREDLKNEEEIEDVRVESYPSLLEYLTDYSVIELRNNRTNSTEYAKIVIKQIKKLLIQSSGDAVKLIEQFETMIRTD